jgi:hypothetical protein
MSLQKYLQTINGIDPGKIYIENVRSLYKLPRFAARLLCEMAVQDNLFTKKIGLVCPNCNRILEEFDSYEQIPNEIECFICNTEEKEQSTFKTADLKKEEFYKLIK